MTKRLAGGILVSDAIVDRRRRRSRTLRLTRVPQSLRLVIALIVWVGGAEVARAQNVVEIDGRNYTLPDGYTIERAVPSSLVERPIHAAFDEQGYLYVTESSGTNDPVAKQLEEKPHRVLRLEDRDRDGIFDERIVFADKLMFPEGAMWFDGSLYVCAPPSIWKFTDTDGDGVSDVREEWFEGKTLTGCANDLHGPYLGRDGWIYWCKGAFAEQEYERADGTVWTTRASHIFRRRPEGGLIESVMTGGMDNPVDVVFTPEGERIFNTTFLQHPGGGRRDGLIHAIYGGVYGKKHGVIEGHPRTGPLMPVLVHLGAAAPSGLHLGESDVWVDPSNRGTILATSFNMRKVTSHVLSEQGASFSTRDEDFLVCDDLDFHPTDLIEDADGSLLVVDTGGWYKLCCPTSQLWKPDILGGIYRVRPVEGPERQDSRGLELDWSQVTDEELVARLDDPRFAVRNRARRVLSKAGSRTIPILEKALDDSPSVRMRREVVWTLSWIDHPDARRATQTALVDSEPSVVHAAIHTTSVWRDSQALGRLHELLEGNSMTLKRAAAEAIGRIGQVESIPRILETIKVEDPRELEHSLIYALIEIGDAEGLRNKLFDYEPVAQRAALIAISQIRQSEIRKDDVGQLFDASYAPLRETVRVLVAEHPQWGELNLRVARELVRELEQGESTPVRLAARLAPFLSSEAIQQELAASIESGDASDELCVAVLAAVVESGGQTIDPVWNLPIQRCLASPQADVRRSALDALQRKQFDLTDAVWLADVRTLASEANEQRHDRLAAIRVLTMAGETIDDPAIEFLCRQLRNDRPASDRTIAVEVLAKQAKAEHLEYLIDSLEGTGPVELAAIVELLPGLFGIGLGEDSAEPLMEQLENHPSTTSIPKENLDKLLAAVPRTLADRANAIHDQAAQLDAERLEKIQRVMTLVENADVRRGQRLFHGTKSSCVACHALGYLGGDIGPDLTRVGRIRSEQDLLEAIIFPSATFVRSYEPLTITTVDGHVYTGLLRNETEQYVDLLINQESSVRVPRDEIEERLLSNVSIMPAGLDQQLTDQELADLVKFLKTSQ